MCRRAAHRERPARFVCKKLQRKNECFFWRSGKSWRLRGGRRQGAKRPERARPGPKAPGALFCLAAGGALRAPPACQTPPPPGAHPTVPASPVPVRLRRPYGGCSWEAGRLRRTCGGAAAFLGPGPLAPALKTSPRPGKARQRAGGRSPPAAAPPPLRFPPTPKRQRKARPHALWGRAHETLSGRVAATVPPPWAKPLPMPYGQRRLHPPHRGLPT